MALFLTGCAAGEQDVDSEQQLSGWYCLVCAGVDARSTVEAHKEREANPPIINKPEKKDD